MATLYAFNVQLVDDQIDGCITFINMVISNLYIVSSEAHERVVGRVVNLWLQFHISGGVVLVAFNP